MRMGQITAENYQAYSQLFQNNGGRKTKSGVGAGIADLSALVGASLTGKPRGADTVSLSKSNFITSGATPAKLGDFDPLLYLNRFTPDNRVKNVEPPDWNSMYLTRDHQHMSDDEYLVAIKERARKDFSEGTCATSENFYNLWGAYISEVSPDRKAIYAESMQKTGGKMNMGSCFFAPDGQVVLHYSENTPQGHSKYGVVFTDKEEARRLKFQELYRAEWAAASKEAKNPAAENNAKSETQIEIKGKVDVMI